MRAHEIILESEKIYHIYNRAIGNEKLFLKDNHYYDFLHKYSIYIEPIAETIAYCLIPNHFHLLIKVKSKKDLFEYFKSLNILKNFDENSDSKEIGHLISHQFGKLFSSYSQSFNKKYDRKGGLFMSGFKRKLVEQPEYFTQLVGYIHSNPIKHDLVKDVNDWTFSSFHAYASSKNSKIKTDFILDFFGSKEAFLEFNNNFNENVVYLKGLTLE